MKIGVLFQEWKRDSWDPWRTGSLLSDSRDEHMGHLGTSGGRWWGKGTLGIFFSLFLLGGPVWPSGFSGLSGEHEGWNSKWEFDSVSAMLLKKRIPNQIDCWVMEKLPGVGRNHDQQQRQMGAQQVCDREGQLLERWQPTSVCKPSQGEVDKSPVQTFDVMF